MLDEFIHEPRIAYFSMEIALRNEIPTYSGGLGVLAGDTLRSAADLEMPMVAVTLVSRRGYFRQEIDTTGRQIEQPDTWEPEQWAKPLAAKVALNIGREVLSRFVPTGPVFVQGFHRNPVEIAANKRSQLSRLGLALR